MIRDKKSGNNAYSAAGDDDINDVAAMGGVNLAEEANVRTIELYNFVKIIFCREFWVLQIMLVQLSDLARTKHFCKLVCCIKESQEYAEKRCLLISIYYDYFESINRAWMPLHKKLSILCPMLLKTD